MGDGITAITPRLTNPICTSPMELIPTIPSIAPTYAFIAGFPGPAFPAAPIFIFVLDVLYHDSTNSTQYPPNLNRDD